MEIYKKIEIKNNNNEYIYDYNLGTNPLYNTTIQKEIEKKFDTLLDGILANQVKDNT